MKSAASPAPAPSVNRDYLRNRELFEEFHALQKEFVHHLAAFPYLVRSWLGAISSRDDGNEDPPASSKSWRASRLTAARQRELSALIAQSEATPGLIEPLAAFLLKTLAVSTYFTIADRAKPSLAVLSPRAHELYRAIEAKRNEIFAANYGLAKAAVRGKKGYDELLSAASQGLLEAIDRYDPHDKRSSSFAYFANTFRIRFQVSRYVQKNGTTVALPINQQRIVKKIERYLAKRRAAGLPKPSEEEVCAELKISPDAYYGYLQRPIMVSLDDTSGTSDEHGEPMAHAENLIASPEPEPDQILEDNEIAAYLRELLRTNVPAHRRVMLSYHRRIGNLADAVEDYLADLQSQALENVRQRVSALGNSTQLPGRLFFADGEGGSPLA